MVFYERIYITRFFETRQVSDFDSPLGRYSVSKTSIWVIINY